ncbi:MAG: Co2+/Mg2+ efflux protein ApaG [Alphaproteobacteria bacterium]|nr:MAG: Co2+/Mg2+ efflux protein ApaG [Alphaproteobacteria bacterium]TAF13632.1 MAG: Co2+/Mg2+ efflux protein ApaG [Alphaproteobacteria bacterium]TAF41721.1 MAG: Co2+/Mg2+ efflux protein ApaG [Alphaproteobacteria bacterium]TAF75662.1 MAG: Co2+/Mg2+ efflux protein ApaG [Alphaproteobacteria bacterium]
MFSKTTHQVEITVIPTYLDDQSDGAQGHYVWAYRVRLENHGERTLQLMNRHWEVMDATGYVQHVRGAGVVGEQPILHAGDVYHYTSGTVLSTSSGMMVGEYEMVDPQTGESFWVEIPAFSLDSTDQMLRPN